jgi:signal peptidase I
VDTLQAETIPDAMDKGKRRSGLMKALVDILETLIWAVVLFVLINLVTARVRVDGSSMLPTLTNGERAIVNKLAYRLGKPERGDIIVFYFPVDPSQEFIKRVIGLPGDQVSIHKGVILINGQRLEEPYLDARIRYEGDWTVADGQLFVLGDNRNNSLDSHNWGTVPFDYVIGKALFIYWPFNTLGVVEHGLPQLVAP